MRNMERCKMRSDFIDLTGKKFGRWTVIERTERPEGIVTRSAFWLCSCECDGKLRKIDSKSLISGKSKSCGCILREGDLRDLSGEKFGKLTVIKRTENDDKGCFQWLCNCDCGTQNFIARGLYLKNGIIKSCGCGWQSSYPRVPAEDLAGQKFGRWTAIRRIDSAGKNARWECICDCKTDKNDTSIVHAGSLTSGHSQSCGCISRERETLPYGQSSFNRLLRNYKRHAKERNFEFLLTEDQFRSLTQQECYYCGKLPGKTMFAEHNNGDYIYNGIDRLDSSKGYFIGNVVPCCKTCNTAKMAMPEEEFYQWVESVYKYCIENRNNENILRKYFVLQIQDANMEIKEE